VTNLLLDRYQVLPDGDGEPLPARVRRALDRQDDLVVGLECYPIAPGASANRLLRRTERLRDLPPHPSLAAVRDGFVVDGTCYVVTEWIPGDPLDRLRPSTRVAMGYLDQIASAVEHLHRYDPALAHGALAPERVLITGQDRAVVTGLGAVLAGVPEGSPYFAPEVLDGESPTPASDIYSLAALAWTLLAGTEPGHGLLSAVSESAREAALVESLLRSGLARDLAQRPQSVLELVRRLRARLTSTLPDGEVTFLLTDVCRSTRLWDTVPDAMAVAIERHDQICAEVVERHGGLYPRDQGEGDSILVVFARPEDAVACAAELQSRLTAEQWPEHAEVSVRAAVHTGQATLRRGGNYRGVGLSVAGRLRSMSHGGQILLSQATVDAVRGRLPVGLDVHDAGLHRLRYLDKPVRVHQLSGPGLPSDLPVPRSPRDVDAQPARIDETALLGRETELAELFAALDSAEQGRPRLVLLSGEAGIGKTSLCQKLAEHARLKEIPVLWGRGTEGSGAPAYWLWRQIFRDLVESCTEEELTSSVADGAAELAAVFPDLRSRIADIPEPAPLGPEAARFRLFESFVTMLRKASTARPLLLVLDDVHWADEPSLRLLEFLAEYLGTAQLLVVVAYRQLEVGGLVRQPESLQLALSKLTREQVARYVEISSGGVQPDSVVDAVFAASEGNPFFLKEIVSLLAAESRFDDPQRLASAALPSGARDVVLRRIRKLPDSTQHLLGVASVIGRDVPVVTLAAVSGAAPPKLLRDLDVASSAGLVVLKPETPGQFSFAHSLVRLALYDSLGPAERVRLHLETARAMERRFESTDAHLAELAYHFLAAAPWGDVTKASEYGCRAAAEAVAHCAYEEGARLYRAVREAPRLGVEALDAGQRCDLLIAEGDALWRAGALGQSHDLLHEAAGLARSAGDGARMATAALTTSKLWIEVGQVDEQVVDILRGALELLEENQHAVRALLLARLAMELSYADGPGEGPDRNLRRTADAVELARQSGDTHAQAFALLAHRYALVGPGQCAERLAASTESIALAQAAGDRELALRSHALRTHDLLEKGDGQAARLELAAFYAQADELRQPFHSNCSTVLATLTALLEGRFAAAEESVGQVFAAAAQSGRDTQLQAAWIQLFFLRREQGRLAELAARAQEIAGAHAVTPGWSALLAMLCLDLGQRDHASQLLEQTLREPIPAIDTTWLATIAILAETAYGLGDKEGSRSLYDLLAPHADQVVVVGVTTPAVCLGSAHRYLALSATTLGQWAEAERHFQAAALANRMLLARPLVAHVYHDWAKLLLTAGDGHRSAPRAAQLLAKTRPIAEDLGMPVLLDRIRFRLPS
jgi:class 3 adenylate cyclase/tetratricopeptide (TPR) repeat protein